MDKAPVDRPLLGASWKIAAFACYAGLNAIARYLSGGAESGLESYLPVYEVVFLQDSFALLMLLPFMMQKRQVFVIPQHFLLHFFRGITSVIAIIAWYYALIYLPLAQAVALSVIGPMIGVVGAKIFLKEKIGWLRSAIIISSLTAVCFLVRPELALKANLNNGAGLIFIVLAAFFFAVAKIATRRLAQHGESPQMLTFYLFLFIVPISFVPAVLNWVTPILAHWPWLILAGLLTALAIYCVSSALANAEVSFLAPFDICQFILNAAVGYFVFMELPPAWTIWIVLAFLGFTLSTRTRRLN